MACGCKKSVRRARKTPWSWIGLGGSLRNRLHLVTRERNQAFSFTDESRGPVGKGYRRMVDHNASATHKFHQERHERLAPRKLLQRLCERLLTHFLSLPAVTYFRQRF